MQGILDGPTASAPSSRARSGVAEDKLATTYRAHAEIFLKRCQYAEAEPLLREALAIRPDDPDILNKLGAALWEQGRPAESEPLFRRAHELRPDDPDFLTHLGLACWDQGRPEEAAECYRRVVEHHPDAITTQMNLGVVLSDLGQFEEALEWLRGVVQKRPENADGWQNLGMTLARLGHWDEALEYYDRALRLRPDYAEVHRNRAYAWLYRGDFARGWPEHEWRLRCRRHLGCRIERPHWTGESLVGKIIVLHYEQGYGDTLQFIRYAPLVKQLGGLVFVLCQARLLRMVARCAGVDLAFDGTALAPDCHVHASLMSLPAIFGTTLETVPARVPYLVNEPIVVERWKSLLDVALSTADDCENGKSVQSGESPPPRPFLIGVAWQGSRLHLSDRWRSFPLAQLARLAALPGVRLISLQTDDGLEQLRAFDGPFPIIDLPSSRPREFHDTAAIMSQLDLVITPDTAVAHLAGGLGIPVWVALSPLPEWRWMANRADCPWYPTMRLFRQSRLGDWNEVFERMAATLETELENRCATGS